MSDYINDNLYQLFSDKYNSLIMQKSENIENERKNLFRMVCLTMAISVIMMLTFTFIFFVLILKTPIYFNLCVLIMLVYALIQQYKTMKKFFEVKLKKLFFPLVADDFELNWNQGKDSNWQKNLYMVAGVIPNYTFLSKDDCFCGKYKDVNFVAEEIVAKKLDKGEKIKQIFKGVVFTFDMNKNFSGNTIIWPDTIMHKSPIEKLHHTVLEDIVFEKNFDVFTNDEIEARYLITTALMERLNTMEIAYNANKIFVSFYENKFYIALQTNKDLFSLGSLSKSVHDKKQFLNILEELSSIILLIEHFKLSERTGL